MEQCFELERKRDLAINEYEKAKRNCENFSEKYINCENNSILRNTQDLWTEEVYQSLKETRKELNNELQRTKKEMEEAKRNYNEERASYFKELMKNKKKEEPNWNYISFNALDIVGLFRLFGTSSNEIIFSSEGKFNKSINLKKPTTYSFMKSKSDFFFSVGTPKKPYQYEKNSLKRNQKSLEYVHLLAVDIDNEGLRRRLDTSYGIIPKKLRKYQMDENIAKTIGVFLNGKIEEEWGPEYKCHVINFTGSGLQLLWAVNKFDPNRKKLSSLADDLLHYFKDFIQEKINEMSDFLETFNLELAVDYSTNVKAQILRLPGSINTKYNVKAKTLYVDKGHERMEMGSAIKEIRMKEKDKAIKEIERRKDLGLPIDYFLQRKANAGSGKEWKNNKFKHNYSIASLNELCEGRINDLTFILKDKGKGIRFNTFSSIISTLLSMDKGITYMVNKIERIDKETNAHFYKDEEHIKSHIKSLEKYWGDKPIRLRTNTIREKSGIDNEYALENNLTFLQDNGRLSMVEKKKLERQKEKRKKDSQIYRRFKKIENKSQVAREYSVTRNTVRDSISRYEKRQEEEKKKLVSLIKGKIKKSESISTLLVTIKTLFTSEEIKELIETNSWQAYSDLLLTENSFLKFEPLFQY